MSLIITCSVLGLNANLFATAYLPQVDNKKSKNLNNIPIFIATSNDDYVVSSSIWKIKQNKKTF